jgi:hypothetical protein
MNPDIFRDYPLVKKLFDQDKAMFGPQEPGLRRQQERAVELIAAEGGGSHEEKEASMICAALIIDPKSLYADIGRFWEGYTEEVTNTVQAMLSTAPDSFLPPAIAQGTAAAGIAQMELLAAELKIGKFSAPPEATLEGVKKAYGQEMENFAYLDAPVLLARYETTRQGVFAALEEKIQPAAPKIRPSKPGNGSFDF